MERLLSTKDVADLLGYHPNQVRALIDGGRLPAVRVPTVARRRGTKTPDAPGEPAKPAKPAPPKWRYRVKESVLKRFVDALPAAETAGERDEATPRPKPKKARPRKAGKLMRFTRRA